MESLRQLHRQLDSVKELRTIVRTMKALSAASIRQYERAVEALAGYYETVERGLHVVFRDLESPPARLGRERHHEGLGVVVFGSDYGLCGRFNEEITQFTMEQLTASPEPHQRPRVLAVGQRVAAALAHEGQAIEEVFLVPGSAAQITATVEQILLKVDEWREEHGVEEVTLFHNRHSAQASYRPRAVELLPIDLRHFRRLKEKRWPSRTLPTFTMNREVLLSRLLHQFLFVSIFRACAESQASEHASRLAAMQSAQRNLDERLEERTTKFRRARQSVITSELLDVVAGFEAITGGGD